MMNAFVRSQAYAFTTVLLWSTAYVFTKIALEHFSAGSLGVLRCAVASLCLLLVVRLKKIPPPKAALLPLFIASGLAGFTLYILAFNLGSSTLNATTSCIIISTSPIMTAVLAGPVFQERLNLWGRAATVLAFGGILIMFLWEGEFFVSPGLAWMLGAALLISIYNLLQRGLSRHCGALQITACSFFCGTLLLLFFLPEAVDELRRASLSQVLLVCFLGGGPGAAAYVIWTKALALAPKTSGVTNYMFLTPFLALMLEYGVMGTVPGPETFAGGAVILAALLLYSVRGRG